MAMWRAVSPFKSAAEILAFFSNSISTCFQILFLFVNDDEAKYTDACIIKLFAVVIVAVLY
jgi:hypothetical protein